MRNLMIALCAGITLASILQATAHNPEGPGKKESHVYYSVDTQKSTLNWQAKKISGSHEGTVNIATGSIILNKGMLAGGQFELDMNTIANTDLSMESMKKKLEGHLRSADFFNVEEFPKAFFKAKLWAPIKDAAEGESNYYIKGDLTIKGITHEITFAARIDMNEKSFIAKASFNIDRTLYDVRYRSQKFFPDIGDKMIDDEFNVSLSLVASAK